MKLIDSIREDVYKKGVMINAPLNLLSIPNVARGDGSPHVEIHGNEYHYVQSERGVEHLRKRTTDLDELMYWLFDSITFVMACKFELYNRVEGQDSRYLIFQHQILLLEKINENWASKMEKEIETILERNPYTNSLRPNIKKSKVQMFKDIFKK